MLVKSQVKYIQSLGHKKFRDAEGVFVAEGPKIVLEFLQSPNMQLIDCFATEKSFQMLKELNLPVGNIISIDEKELDRISFMTTPNQLLAVFKKPVFEKSTPFGLTLLLDTIQDPGNLGTIVRTADWFGVKKVVCSPDTVDAFNPKVVQSAMGSLSRVDLEYTGLEEYIRLYQTIPVYSGSLDGEDLREKLRIKDAFLLMGNESKGVSAMLESLAEKKIRIPRKGAAESLNVAVATGILLSQMEMLS